jgi:hypothetical protein
MLVVNAYSRLNWLNINIIYNLLFIFLFLICLEFICFYMIILT